MNDTALLAAFLDELRREFEVIPHPEGGYLLRRQDHPPQRLVVTDELFGAYFRRADAEHTDSDLPPGFTDRQQELLSLLGIDVVATLVASGYPSGRNYVTEIGLRRRHDGVEWYRVEDPVDPSDAAIPEPDPDLRWGPD